MTPKIKDLLDKQVELELSSHLFYLRTAIQCKINGYEGLHKFFKTQSDEEREHKLMFIEYMADLGVEHSFKYDLGEITTSSSMVEEFSILPLFYDSLEMEKEVSENIKLIASESLKENDLDTFEFIQWFIKEQREEEGKFGLLVQKAKLLENNSVGTYLLDQELGK